MPRKTEGVISQVKILTLDIDALSLRQLRPAVMEMGVEMLTAADPSDALSQIEQQHPDILLLDLQSQAATDYAIIDQMGQSDSQLPVIFLAEDAAVDAPALDGRPTATLTLPIVMDSLRQVIGQVTQPTNHVVSPSTMGTVANLGDYGSMLCNSRSMQDVMEMVHQVAGTNITVLVRGESGTGKELIARTLFQQSLRHDKPFVKVLCAALPEGLLESELFGYERGAFTGAHKRKPGKFEFAHQGTIFLDEIGEVPITLQSKLLQVLQDGEFVRLGGEQDIKVDVRIIAATNRELEDCVRMGTFREDLFYRLNVVSITLPPLRDRLEEIPFLLEFFMDKFSRQYKRQMPKLTRATMDCFMHYQWPGNIRELENMVKQVVVLGNEQAMLKKFEQLQHQGGSIAPSILPDPMTAPPVAPPAPPGPDSDWSQPPDTPTGPPVTPAGEIDTAELASTIAAGIAEGHLPLKEIGKRAASLAEREAILQVLNHTRWNRRKAAVILGISYKALLYKIRDYGLNDAP